MIPRKPTCSNTFNKRKIIYQGYQVNQIFLNVSIMINWERNGLHEISSFWCNYWEYKILQWTLVITNFLGPVKLLCYISKFCYIYTGCKNNKIQQKKLNFGTKKITLLYRDFVISVFFIMRVHCTRYENSFDTFDH